MENQEECLEDVEAKMYVKDGLDPQDILCPQQMFKRKKSFFRKVSFLEN